MCGSDASPAEELHRKQMNALHSQTLRYAQDLRAVVEMERRKSRELAAANEKLEVYARDLKAAYDAEERRSEELQAAYQEMVMRLTLAAVYKDEETGAHVQRVSQFSRIVAEHVGLNLEEIELLASAAPMHDIGKIAVRDAILLRPGPLDQDGWESMKMHTVFGASLLEGSPSPLLETARVVALTHHERWDGTGYPAGLQGEQIPDSGRIVMLVDVYDALRTRRPYKEALSHEQACLIILEGDNRTLPQHFDPHLLEIFRRIHRDLEAVYAAITE